MARKKKSYGQLVEEDSYCRNYNIEIWEKWNDDVKDPGYKYSSCDDVLKYINSNYKYYIYCKHDKDIWTPSDYEEKKEYMDEKGIKVGDHKQNHYQIFVHFTNARWKSTVAKELNIPFSCIIKANSYKGSVMYVIHENETEKYHYDVSEAKGTLIPELLKYIGLVRTEEEKSDEVMSLIFSRKYWTLKDLLTEINNRCLYSHFIRGYSLYKDIISEQREGVYFSDLVKNLNKEKEYPWN